MLRWPCKAIFSLRGKSQEVYEWVAGWILFVLLWSVQTLTDSIRGLSLSFVQTGVCTWSVCVSVLLPAVCHYRPSIRRVEELDLSYESKQSGGIAGNAVVRPAGEMKLTEFADLVMTLLKNTHETLEPSCIFYNSLKNDSLPFSLLMMTNAWISQILSWPFWERLTRRHIMVQQTNLQQGLQEPRGHVASLWLQMETKLISWMSQWHFGPLLGMRDRKTYRASFA